MTNSTSDTIKNCLESTKTFLHDLEGTTKYLLTLAEQASIHETEIDTHGDSIEKLKETTKNHQDKISMVRRETLKESDANKRFETKSVVISLKDSADKLLGDAANYATNSAVQQNTDNIALNALNIEHNSIMVGTVREKTDSNAGRITSLEETCLTKDAATHAYTPFKTSRNHENKILRLEYDTVTTKMARSMFAPVSSVADQQKVLNYVQEKYITKNDANSLYGLKTTIDDHAQKIKGIQDDCLTKEDAKKQLVKKDEHDELKDGFAAWKHGIRVRRDEEREKLHALRSKTKDLNILRDIAEIRMHATERYQAEQTAMICSRVFEGMEWTSDSIRRDRKRKTNVELNRQTKPKRKCRRGGRGRGGRDKKKPTTSGVAK